MAETGAGKEREAWTPGTPRREDALRRWELSALAVAALGTGLAFATADTGHFLIRFQQAYLVNYFFCLSLSLGALFFVLLQHVVGMGWSVPVRRLAEIIARALPFWALLFLPILLPLWADRSALYPWAGPRGGGGPEWQRTWLNVPAFTLRWILYFGVWGGLAWFLLRASLDQDQGSPARLRQMERFSPFALLLLLATGTLAALDGLMSLNPRWSSPLFGLHFLSGCVCGGTALTTLAALFLRPRGLPEGVVTAERCGNLGVLLWVSLGCWIYLAVPPLLLHWYTHLPEEAVFLGRRLRGNWAWVSAALLVGQFLPLAGLPAFGAWRHRAALAFWAGWILCFHWLDLYWLVLPEQTVLVHPRAADAAWLLGLGGLYLAVLARLARGLPLAPAGDPRCRPAPAGGAEDASGKQGAGQ